MLDFLFARLTAGRERGSAAFEAVTAIVREPAFYRKGRVPDTIDGRFAVLATVTALLLARLEREGEAGDRESAAVTERFIAAMEAEHRELGLGDPTLGKTVRKLVGALSRRLDLWRAALAGTADWEDTTLQSLYSGRADPSALASAADRLRAIARRFERASVGEIGEGRFE